jgi:hypothetical protein
MRAAIWRWRIRRSAWCGATLTVLAVLAPAGSEAQHIRLEARTGAGTVTLTRSSLPAAFDGTAPALLPSLLWQAARPGLHWAEVDLVAGRARIPVRAVLARLEPSHFRIRLDLVTQSNRMTGAWTVDMAPDSAVLAVNAGQFLETGPWGWVVLDGREHREPGRGPLAVGIAVDTAGRVRWIADADLPRAAGDPGIMYAFQSYPLLLHEGRVPPLTRDARAVNHGHRDARLILAELPDGALLIVLTRYGALGDVGQRLPIGLTLPEAVLLMGALGARHAVMLDGGVSAQLLLRPAAGEAQQWHGLRRVPLALIATPREPGYE